MDSTKALITIEDEAVALAPKISEAGRMPYILIAIGVCSFLLIIVAYIMICQKYRYRIQQLTEDSADKTVGYKSWKLHALKRQVEMLEQETAEKILQV